MLLDVKKICFFYPLLGILKNRATLHKLESNYFLNYGDITAPPVPSLSYCLQPCQIHYFCVPRDLSVPSVSILVVSGRDGKGFILSIVCDTCVTDQTIPTLKT